MIILVSSILVLALVALPLRGGALHNHIVSEAEAICRSEGLETSREQPEPLSDGSTDFIDLAARSGDDLVCIEVETSVRNVVSNALKAERLGCPLIVLVPAIAVHRAVLRKLRRHAIRPGGRAICVLLLAQLRQGLRNCFPLISPANAQGENRKSNQSNEASPPTHPDPLKGR